MKDLEKLMNKKALEKVASETGNKYLEKIASKQMVKAYGKRVWEAVKPDTRGLKEVGKGARAASISRNATKKGKSGNYLSLDEINRRANRDSKVAQGLAVAKRGTIGAAAALGGKKAVSSSKDEK